MAVPLKGLGDKVSYQEVNDILKLFASNTSPVDPFEGQIWLDLSSSPYVLYRWNGSSWKRIGMTGEQILSFLNDVDGSGSGLDSDTLDGQEGSYYQDAGNLNAGTIPGPRFGFWEDSGGDNSSPCVQSGSTSIPASVTTINFPSAFTSTPRVIAVPYTANASYAHTVHTRNTTTTSFRVSIFDDSGNLNAGTVVWIAIGEKE